ncbi:MAG: reverse transcriptase family protein [Chryseobacterium sp.]
MKKNPRSSMMILANNLAKILVRNSDFRLLLLDLKKSMDNSLGFCSFLNCTIPSDPIHDYEMVKLAKEMIFAFAFRQNRIFKNESKKTLAPFYKTHWINKGAGRRRKIDIPRDCLKTIQSYILKVLLEPSLAELPDFVVCKPGQSTINGASKHIHAYYLVNMDLKNFYPSIRVAQVITLLKKIPRHGFLNRGTPDGPEPDNQKLSHWESVLIGRLLTWQGILPQGAPTSPAIANLIFKDYDDRIIENLGTGFKYTRYMDDITVSLTRPEARMIAVDNETMMKRRAILAVNESIKLSGFKLNHTKTQVSKLGPPSSGFGHKITGFRVGFGEISLPKNICKFFRALEYRIRGENGNIYTLINKNKKFKRKATALKEYPELLQHYFSGSKQSMEWMAANVFFYLHPELKINGETYFGSPSINREWFEVTLYKLWTKELLALPMAGNCIKIVNLNKVTQAILESKNRPDFLLLEKETAVSVVEYFFWLTGHISRLFIPEKFYEISQRIRNLDLRFKPLIQQLCVKLDLTSEIISSNDILINKPEESGYQYPFDSISSQTSKQIFENKMKVVIKKWEHYLNAIEDKKENVNSPLDSTQFLALLSFAENKTELENWLKVLRHTFVYKTKKIFPITNNKQPFEIITILSQIAEGKRNTNYECMKSILETNKLPTDLNKIQQVQQRIAEYLKLYFSNSEKEHRKSSNWEPQDNDKWVEILVQNPWYVRDQETNGPEEKTLAKRWFKDLGDRFNFVYKKLVELNVLFDDQESLNKCILEINYITDNEPGDEGCWDHLFKLGKCIKIQIDEKLTPEYNKYVEKDKKIKLFDKIFSQNFSDYWQTYILINDLRCRESHGFMNEQAGNWLSIQKKIAKKIGRLFIGNKKDFENPKGAILFPEGKYLKLTEIELYESKQEILRDLINGLTNMVTFFENSSQNRLVNKKDKTVMINH